jgi:NADH-quinone oxidoreductase subunit L
MGALKNRLPVTFWTFLFGTLALSGVWPLSGFFSKDEVLATAASNNPVLFGIAVLVAVLTTFYMFRLVFVVFYGPEKSHEAEHAHESPAVMTMPLIILAIPTVIAGFFGIDAFLNAGGHEASHAPGFFGQLLAPFSHAPLGALFGLGAVLFGFTLAYALYYRRSSDPIPQYANGFSRLLRNRFYFDELYTSVIALTHENLARLASIIDRWLIAGVLVRGLQGTTELAGRVLRLAQTGNLQTYAFLFVLGLAVLLFVFLRP